MLIDASKVYRHKKKRVGQAGDIPLAAVEYMVVLHKRHFLLLKC